MFEIYLNARKRFREAFLHRFAQPGLRFNIEFVKQPNKIRIGSIVENDEAGVDAEIRTIKLNINCVSVTADVIGGFKKSDVVLLA